MHIPSGSDTCWRHTCTCAKPSIRNGQNPNISGFLQLTFLGPQAKHKWRPILGLRSLNKFLKSEKFKMETPESIKTCHQTGEWLTSIDCKDAYFHPLIKSRKYLNFQTTGQSYQLKALPCRLHCHMEFAMVVKAKLMAQNKGIRISQYMNDRQFRARPHHACFLDAQTLMTLYQELS